VSRTKFIWAYIAVMLVTLYGGVPWSYLFVFMSARTGPVETPPHFYFFALVAPACLVWVAHARGGSIGRPRLALFPIGALLLSFFGVFWDRYFSGAPAAMNRGTTTPVVALLSLYGPGLVHAICFSIGAKLRASTSIERNQPLGAVTNDEPDSAKKGEPAVFAMAFVNCVAILPLALLFRLGASNGQTIIFCAVIVLFIAMFTAAGVAAAKGKFRNSAVAIAGMAWPSFVVAFIALNYILRLMGGKI
jgi:hypothetical protein